MRGSCKHEYTMAKRILFSDFALSRRLDPREGHACARFAEARRRLARNSDGAVFNR
jgi:hypothetical protein